jgi:hypothetical protein
MDAFGQKQTGRRMAEDVKAHRAYCGGLSDWFPNSADEIRLP